MVSGLWVEVWGPRVVTGLQLYQMRDYTGSQGAVYWSMGGGVLWWSPVSHEGLYRLSVCRLMVYEWSYRVLGWSQVSH